MKFNAVISIVVFAGVTLAAQAPTKQPAVKQAPAKAAPASQLPAAVAEAFKKAYPNATIKNASSERENGKIQWEVESIDGTAHRDVIYLPDGTLVEEELIVDAASVPAPVIAALNARYPRATVSVYEKLTTPSAAVSYELHIKGAAVREVEIAPDGTFIRPKPAGKKKQERAR
jgi:hypothetical protein